MDNILDYRTDMAVESVNDSLLKNASNIRGFVKTDVKVTAENAEEFKKDAGRYITLDGNRDYNCFDAADCIADALRSLVPSYKSALIVGLGNEAMVADALGPAAVKQIIVTRHIYDEMKRDYGAGQVSAFCPNVLGVTGIESYDIISGVVEKLKPDIIICIDSLAGRRTERIGVSFQLTDTGISPGSGLGIRRLKLNKKSLNIPVIALGVPLVVFARTIALDAVSFYSPPEKELKETINAVTGNLVVTPKEIDILVSRAAYASALGINQYLHAGMSSAEIRNFMSGNY